MESMRRREQSRQLHGRVQIDDAYLGGERCGGKEGRASEKTVPYVVAVRTIGPGAAPDLVCVQQLPFRKEAIAEFCAKHLVRPLTVTLVSNGLACCRAAAEAGVHEAIVTGGGAAAAGSPSSTP